MEKAQAYKKLAKKRQTQCFEGYFNIGDYHDGAYECDHVSPYTKGAFNLDAEVMFFLQDWASDEWMRTPINPESFELGRSNKFPTNRNMEKWFKQHFNLEIEDTFGTNVFPFIKKGSMSAGIPDKDVKRAAIEFGAPMVDIVKPKVVIAFGLKTFNGLRTAAGLKPVSKLAEAISLPFLLNGTKVFCLAHPGQMGTISRNRGGVNRVSEDWAQVAKEVHSLKN